MPPFLTALLLGREGRVRSGWKVLAFAVVYLLAIEGILTLLHLAGVLDRLAPGSAASVWMDAGFAALATGVCLAAERRPLLSVGLVPDRRWALEFLAGVAAGLGVILLTALLVRGAGGFRWTRNPAAHPAALLASAWLYLAVAFNEELLCRGYPFQRLVQGLGPWGGQILFALLFAAMHWGNPGMTGATRVWATLNIGLAAILLGLAWIRTGSLALPIGIHLGWNWTQGSLLGFGVSGTTDGPGLLAPVFRGRPEWLTGGAFGLEASLPCTLVCAAAILLLARWRGRAPENPGA